MRINLIEQVVYHYPKGLEGWRMYRIEYGGHAENCVYEGMIWLPGWVDPEQTEGILMSKNPEKVERPHEWSEPPIIPDHYYCISCGTWIPCGQLCSCQQTG